MEEAYSDMKSLIDFEKYKSLKAHEEQICFLVDYKCLSAIRIAVKNSKRDIANYKKSISILSQLIAEDQKPFVTRIDSKSIKQSFDMTQLDSKSLQKKMQTGVTSTTLAGTHPSMPIDVVLNEAPNNSYVQEIAASSKENIFEREDFFLYRGVMQFYCKNYKQAISDFEESANVKKECKALTMPKEMIEPSETSSIDTDLSDVGLCSLNVNEYQFNVILCYILVKISQSIGRLGILIQHLRNAPL